MRGVFCSDTQRQPRPDRPAPSPSAPPRAPHSRPARKRKAGPAGADPPPPSEPEGQAEVCVFHDPPPLGCLTKGRAFKGCLLTFVGRVLGLAGGHGQSCLGTRPRHF